MEYAIVNKKQIHINDVKRGTIGECMACGQKLTAKKGNKKQYWSHEKGNSTDCDLKVQHILKEQKEQREYDLNHSEIDNIYGNVYNNDIEAVDGFTEEQLAIINSTERRVKVDAKVGVGKTATIEEYIKRNKDKRILYLVYNKSMRIEAEERFGDIGNVDIRTTYSMAYQYFGAEYRSKLKPSINIFDMAKVVGLFMKSPFDFELITECLELFQYYLTSSHHNIDDFISKDRSRFIFNISTKHIQYIKKMFKMSYDKKCNITHDFYFKLWHLSKPDFSKMYDVVSLDETQDNSSALVDIIDNNTEVGKIIIVGDRHQAIYQFANCVNGLEILNEGWTEYKLTKSFRIGNTQAKVIRDTMSEVLNTEFKLEGYNKSQNVVSSIDKDKPHFKICRYNATILKEAMTAVSKGKKIHIDNKNIKSNFTYIRQMYDFKFHDKKHFSLKRFETYEHLLAYAKKVDDYNTLFINGLIEEHDKDLLSILENIEDNMVNDWKLADISYITGHRVKGKTITIPVVLANDFYDWNDDRLCDPIPEINVTYVAISRSKSDMELPSFLLNIYLNGIGNNKPKDDILIDPSTGRSYNVGDLTQAKKQSFIDQTMHLIDENMDTMFDMDRFEIELAVNESAEHEIIRTNMKYIENISSKNKPQSTMDINFVEHDRPFKSASDMIDSVERQGRHRNMIERGCAPDNPNAYQRELINREGDLSNYDMTEDLAFGDVIGEDY